MSSPLEEFCNLVADVGIEKATTISTQLEGFLSILSKEAKINLDDEARQTIFLGVAFMSVTFANGVWSNLNSTSLRRDLLDTSIQTFTLKAATKISGSQEHHDVAFLAVSIDEQLRSYYKDYIERMKQVEESGKAADTNEAALFGLEWIQGKLDIPDSVMNRLVPVAVGLGAIEDLASEVQSVAAQVNRAANERGKRGFLSKLFRS